MQTAVYVLYQRHELEKASCFLTQIAPFIRHDVQLYLLINDQDCLAIRQVAARLSPHMKIVTVGQNLGVAGGRNYLIRHAIDEGAEFLISCDTDIIFEVDYFRRMTRAYASLRASDPQIGLVQPVLFNGPDVLSCFSAFNEIGRWSDLQVRLQKDTSLQQPFWPRIRDTLGEPAALRAVMHTGMSNVWRAHFGQPIDDGTRAPEQDAAFLKTYLTRASSLRSDPPALENVLAEGRPVRIGTAAGGISAFHRSVFETSGGYDEIFNPFGYEDSEFGFRSQAAGFHHYLVPSCAAIHDIFASGQNRSLMYQARIGLLRGVEAGGKWVKAAERNFALRQSLLYGVKNLVGTFARDAQSQPAKSAQLTQLLPSALASYGFEFFRGLLHSAQGGGAADWAGLTELLKPGPAEIYDFVLPLDEKVGFQIHRLIKRGDLSLAQGQSFSLHGFNCHIAEQSSEALLQSRHFDLSMQVRRHSTTQDHSLQLDILSDDVLHKLEIGFTVDFVNAAKDGILRITGFKVQSKVHDYGSFSIEDIYPQPRLHESQHWLPLVENELTATAAIHPAFGLQPVVAALIGYLRSGQPVPTHQPDMQDVSLAAMPSLADATAATPRKRVLIFTDSRGQHKPKGTNHKMFAERLAEDPRLQVEFRLCPMKWTTTLDFLAKYPAEQIASYDHVILYTGIVDWAPRPLSNASDDLYDNPHLANLEHWDLNTTNYSRKVVNNKRPIFDEVFGVEEMARHFSAPFGTTFENEPSINMYRLSAARERLIPKLVAMPNLIFITANRIADGWNGDYPRERPANMNVIHDYSRAFAEAFPAERLVDLMAWSEEEVKVMTCDNLHLTDMGNTYIHNALLHRIFTPKMLASAQTSLDGGSVKIGPAAFVRDELPHKLLIQAAADLLLEPALALPKIEGHLASTIADCLTRVRQDDPIRVHFLRVRDFARCKTVRSGRAGP